MQKSYKETFYPESRFGGFTDIDGTIRFYFRVNALVRPESVVLDYGCGRGRHDEQPLPIKRDLLRFKGRVARVIGMDVDPAGQENPLLDEFHRLDPADPKWPLPDDSVDVCYCDHVLEHVEKPEIFFSEARRVLRKGGYLCIRTPNAWGYVGLVSRMVPNRHHAQVLKQVEERPKDEADVFPTVYRANSVRRLRRFLRSNGFDAVVYGAESEPTYLRFSKLAYYLGVLHQRFAPGFMRLSILAFARRID